jgi:hypothetical protein
MGVERRVKTRQRKTLKCYEMKQRASDLYRFSINKVSNQNFWVRGH